MKKLFLLFLLAIIFNTGYAVTKTNQGKSVLKTDGKTDIEPYFDFYERVPYRNNIPKPEDLLQYKIGEHHTTYAQMELVIKSIAKAASDRVRIFEIGRTNEHRMQYLVAVSSPGNISRLEEIKGDLTKISNPQNISAGEANKLIENTPIAVWLSYAIHGNESSSFETMMQVVYQLAASEEPATQKILENSVALILVCGNPDGHERFATWYNSVAAGNPDRNALEHNEPWSVNGRLSHYRFDLNRDNIAATQKETQNLQKAFFEWNPQISADHHGQPSQYFFPPNAEPINPNLPQPDTSKWLKIFGRANAEQFDKRKWDYYTGDIFDLFYPGYWDSFPSLTGATAMTYETDGGGFKGLRWRRDDGTISTFRSSIAKHFVASMTTLDTAVANRTEKMRDFHRFKQSAIEEGKTEKMKRIIISPDNDPVKAAELIEILSRAKIEVKIAGTSFSSAKAYSYENKNASAKPQTFPAGSYVIELAQPQKRLAKALLEPETMLDSKFIEEEFAAFKRNEMRGKSAPRDYYRFYDITAWSLPLAFGLDAFWTEDNSPMPNASTVTEDYLKRVKTGKINGGQAKYAYIFSYETDNAPILAYRLQKEGFRVHSAARRLNAGGKDWSAGTFVVRLTRNSEKIHSAVERLASELGVKVTAVNSGYIESGDTGIGSENILPLKLPKIAIAVGDGVELTSYGTIWWTFDRAGIEFTALELDKINPNNLKDFNVLILPNGRPDSYTKVLTGIKDWIKSGGTVICIKGAAVAATRKEVDLTTAKIVGSSEDESKKPLDSESKSTETDKKSNQDSEAGNKIINSVIPPIVSPTANAGQIPENVPGAIMRATIDRTTYLTFGLQTRETLPVLLSGGNFFRISKEGVNAVVFDANPKDSLTISGFVWRNNTERLLKGTAYLIDEPTGSGHVILFAEDPLFRGIFRNSARLFYNSVMLAPTN